jgi:very-short-patch-repair endonuclease
VGFNPLGEYWKRLYPLTEAERAIEPAVAALGIPYRSQFPCFLYGMGKWFPDYLFPTIGVVLEVDDDSHSENEKKAADALRTAALETLGYVVVRCSNDEALFQPSETVQRLIVDAGLLNRKGPGLPVPPCRTRKRKRGPAGRRSTPKAPVAGTRRSSLLPNPNHTRTHENKI